MAVMQEDWLNERENLNPAWTLPALQGQRIHRHRHGPTQRDARRTRCLPARVRRARHVGPSQGDVLGVGED